MNCGSADSGGPAYPPAPALTSPLLRRAGFRHAFFYRAGGVSQGRYASLNFSYAVGDAPDNVDQNLRRASGALDISWDRIFFLAQVHGSDVIELRGAESQRRILFTEGDALVSGVGDLACGVRTADCVPILLANQTSGRVAAIHAGWRGTVRRVIDRAGALLGGDPTDWLAAIGPHISASSFEVSEEVAERILNVAEPDCLSRPTDAKPHIDLRRVVTHQLTRLGVPAEQIDHVRGCTQSEAERFFSFRRDGKHSGRHLSAIVALPERNESGHPAVTSTRA